MDRDRKGKSSLHLTLEQILANRMRTKFRGQVSQEPISANSGVKFNPPLDSVSQRLTQTANHGVVSQVNDLCLKNVS